MQTHIIKSGVVVNTILATVAEAQAAYPDATCIEATDGGIGWGYDGTTLTPPAAPPKTPEQLQAEIVNGAQQRLDDFARTRNYDGILSLCTYATDTFPKFAAEGQYGVQARSTTWAALYQILGEVAAGNRPLPSGYTDVEADLPELVWPE